MFFCPHQKALIYESPKKCLQHWEKIPTVTILRWYFQTVLAAMTLCRFLQCLKLTLYSQVFTLPWRDLSQISHVLTKRFVLIATPHDVQLLLMQNYRLHSFNSTFTLRKLSGSHRKKKIHPWTLWHGEVLFKATSMSHFSTQLLRKGLCFLTHQRQMEHRQISLQLLGYLGDTGQAWILERLSRSPWVCG